MTNTANPSLSRSLIWLLAVGGGLVVANLYYHQPLLAMIARDLGQSESAVSRIPMFIQIGYATGLLLIVPLGDMFRRRRIILLDFAGIVLSMIVFAVSGSLTAMLVAGFFLGLTSVIPQIFIPLTAQLSSEKDTAKNVAIVVSGILIGVLVSRVFSGMVGGYFGWRMVYFIAAAIVFVLALSVGLMMPEVKPTFTGTYGELMRSIAHYVRIFPDLRIAAFRGALVCASSSIFWTTLVFRLGEAPFFAGSDVAGLLSLVCIVGAVTANLTGRITNKVNPNLIISIGVLVMISSWLVFGLASVSYAGLITGIVLLDMGIQATYVSNQSLIFARHREATNRINTAYMVTYFLGGAVGTWVGGTVWGVWGWTGVVYAGVCFLILGLAAHLLYLGRHKINNAGK